MLYLVLELCKGGDLRDHIHAGDATSMQGADDAALAMPEEDALWKIVLHSRAFTITLPCEN